MNLKLRNVWTWRGEIDRKTFVFWGLLLFAAKYGLDHLLVGLAFQQPWPLLSYFTAAPLGTREASPAHPTLELFALFALAIPFLWAGAALCLRRLRGARLPLWLVVLFVVPVLKWILFVILAATPDREPDVDTADPVPPRLPSALWGSAGVAVAGGALLGCGAMLLGVTLWSDYGWALFAGTPFIMGFVSSLLYGAQQRRSLRASLGVAVASVVVTGLALVAFAMEGALCLLMAAPIAFAVALIGAAAGHAALELGRRRSSSQVLCAAVLALPIMLAAEKIDPAPPPLLRVETAVEVRAPIETVWRHVIEFSELPPPREAVFKLGIAYPIRAQISGHGPGAVRSCVFSTGPFIEPIEQWNEPTLLQFSVIHNPEPLQELTPYPSIHPPHLQGFLVSQKGQFALKPLAPDRTLLTGTTWYRHSMWPASYWQLWSDYIIHTIHRRVLVQIKQVAESDALHSSGMP